MKSAHRRTWSLAVLALAGLALSVSSARAEREFPEDYFYKVPIEGLQEKFDAMTGQARPKLELSDWMNGEFSDGDLEGKILVVDIWATWCGPCLAAIPENNKLAKQYGEKGVVVIGVCSSSRGQDKMGETAEKHEIAYPIAKDPEEKTSEAWNVAFYPTYAVVDRKGVLRAIGLKPSHIEDVVKKILEEQPAEPAQEAKGEGSSN